MTGASSGIGRATALRLAAAGVNVTAVARTAQALEKLQDESRADEGAGRGAVSVVAADVATEDGVEAVRAAVQRVDIVVHAAGAFELAPLVETSVESFDRMIAVNLRAAFLLVRAFVPDMLARGAGHVVTIGSVAGRHAFPANGAYSASKFGVRGMHAVLAAELRGTGVRASLVEPAATDTPLWDAVDRSTHTGLPEAAEMLSADDVATAVLYAVSQPDDVAIPNILVERA